MLATSDNIFMCGLNDMMLMITLTTARKKGFLMLIKIIVALFINQMSDKISEYEYSVADNTYVKSFILILS